MLQCLIGIVDEVYPRLAALADPARFDSTRSLTAAFEAEGIRFDDLGADETEQAEVIVCAFQGSDYGDIVFECCIDENSVKILSRDLTEVDPDRLFEVYEAINELNADERWVRFTLDEETNFIRVEYDLPYDTMDSFGIMCSYILRRMLTIADNAREGFAAFAPAAEDDAAPKE